MTVEGIRICVTMANGAGEKEQRLTVKADGRVWFNAYARDGRKCRSEKLNVGRKNARQILSEAGEVLRDKLEEPWDDICGETPDRVWLFYEDGEEVSGTVWSEDFNDVCGLYELIRSLIPVPGLFERGEGERLVSCR